MSLIDGSALRCAALVAAFWGLSGSLVRAYENPFADNTVPVVAPIVKATSSTEADDFDRHLVNENTVNGKTANANASAIARVHVDDCQACPNVQPCPSVPGAPAGPPAPPTGPNAPPPAPSSPPSGQPSPYGQMPAPSGQLPSTSPQGQSALQTALNMGGEPGLGFGNAPSMLGDFFSGHPTRPVFLQSPATVNNAYVEIFPIESGSSTNSSINVYNPHDSTSATFTYAAPLPRLPNGVTFQTLMQSSDVPSPNLSPSFPLPNIASNLPFGNFGYTYQFNADPSANVSQGRPANANATPLNIIVQPNEEAALESYLTKTGVPFLHKTQSPGYITVPQPPGASSGVVYYDSTHNETYSYVYTTYTPMYKIQLPDAATAGTIKLGDNTSPIPRDRIIFDYSFFDGTTLVPGGLDVSRFVAGFEKTLFSDRFSVEFRIPFATTLDSEITMNVGTEPGANPGSVAGTNASTVELGNAALWAKELFWKDSTTAASAGLGLGVPTAANIQLSRSDGTELYEIYNHAYHLLPFLGAVWTPTERFFVQGLLQADIDLGGNPVTINQDPNKLYSQYGVFKDAGRLTDPVFMFCDISAGYWIFHDPPGSSRALTGLAALFELHYNQSLGGFNSVSAPMIDSTGHELDFWNPAIQDIQPLALQLGGGNAFSSIDLTAGLTAEIRENTFLSLGCAVPVTGGASHEFEYEIRANLNIYFGRSTKSYRVGSASAPSTL